MSDEQTERPNSDDREVWSAYWTAQEMAWRTEPEIDMERQAYLAERRAVKPDIEQGIYPFRDEHCGIKLTRADVEWLLATHEDKGIRGPVEWTEEKSRWRAGIDLRGAILSDEDLSGLPLARIVGGFSGGNVPASRQWERTRSIRDEAALHLEGVNLIGAHLEHANLAFAYLESAQLNDAHLECAVLRWAHISGSSLYGAHLEGAELAQADLTYAWALSAHFEAANMGGAILDHAELNTAHFEGTTLINARCQGADLTEAHMQGANLQGAHLEGTILEGAELGGKQMSTADLERLRQWSPRFLSTLPAARLAGVFFDTATRLRAIHLGETKLGWVSLVDAHFGAVNLGVVDWKQVYMLGEEREVRQPLQPLKFMQPGILQYMLQQAVQANRQLAAALRDQGLHEAADRFSLRAHCCQRIVLRYEKHYLRWFGSLLLDRVSGYGYLPFRTLAVYSGTIFAFMVLFLFVSQPGTSMLLSCPAGALALKSCHVVSTHLSWDEALVLSVSSFHGRGFFNPNISLGDSQARLAALEAVLGLFIEVSFIATFTQRFFGK